MSEGPQPETLAAAFRADARSARSLGDYDNARVAEEAAHRVELTGDRKPLRAFKGLEYSKP